MEIKEEGEIMTIREAKKELLKWKDFYGQDIADTESIKKAKSFKELKNIINNHIRWLELQHNDAMTHASDFLKLICCGKK
jgi:hypothetical protein